MFRAPPPYATRTFKLYDTLHLPKSATHVDIKRQYRQLAKVLHPDKPTGNAEEFKQLNKAYEILNDEQKRAQYDEGGDEFLAQPGTGGGEGAPGASFGFPFGTQNQTPNHPFSQFFPGAFQRFFAGAQPEPNVTHQRLELTLEEMYKGGTRSIEIKEKVSCLDCGGRGGEATVCLACKGTGQCQITKMMAPNIRQIIQSACQSCKGKGKILVRLCNMCSGQEYVEKVSKHLLQYPPGVLTGDEIEIRNEKDTSNDSTILIHIAEKPHPIVQRHLFDLKTTQKLSLTQALTGFDILVPHLSGKTLRINVGQAILPQQWYLIKNYGMPIDTMYKTKLRMTGPLRPSYGDLYIKFDVEWPQQLSPMQKQAVLKYFPFKNNIAPTPDLLEDVLMEPHQKEINDEKEAQEQAQSGGVHCRTQ